MVSMSLRINSQSRAGLAPREQEGRQPADRVRVGNSDSFSAEVKRHLSRTEQERRTSDEPSRAAWSAYPSVEESPQKAIQLQGAPRSSSAMRTKPSRSQSSAATDFQSGTASSKCRWISELRNDKLNVGADDDGALVNKRFSTACRPSMARLTTGTNCNLEIFSHQRLQGGVSATRAIRKC